MTSLKVFFKDKLAGHLTEDKRNPNVQYTFQYEKQYLNEPDARPLSVNLPLQIKPFQSEKLFPFFDNLLAEGWLLNHQLTTYKLKKEERFELISRCGLEAMGAVSIREEIDA